MGKSIIIKGADFSINAIGVQNLFNIADVRRNYAVLYNANTLTATIGAYDKLCVSGYIRIPASATKIHVSGLHATGNIRYRFTTAQDDDEATTENGILATAGVSEATVNVPSNSSYTYFSATIYSGASAAAAASADLSNVSVEAIFS